MPAALGNMSKHYCARLHEFWENILPTNFTNLHEFFALQFNGDLVGRHFNPLQLFVSIRAIRGLKFFVDYFLLRPQETTSSCLKLFLLSSQK